ncbi:MAG: cell division protein FtsZ, partial [Treponema sp.]|nr:cell division protein FtsZ [Treponema sp.]
LITKTGIVNTDFADVESTMKGQGDALMGIGIGSGENRAKDAAAEAIDNPMLEDTSIDGATHILVNIAGPEDFSLVEMDEVMNTIKSKADSDVEVIMGILYDTSLGSNVRVTVIATGFKAHTNQQIVPEIGSRKQESEIIDIGEWVGMLGQSKSKRADCLSPRNYLDCTGDLDIPTLVRNQNYNPDTAEQTPKAAGSMSY